MTRDTILAQLYQAKAALNARNCDRAFAALQLAWDDLGAFQEQLAAAGRKPTEAIKLHKKLAQAYAALRRRCGGNALMPPSGRSPSSHPDLIAPTFAPAQRHPDLIAPSFSGLGAGMLVEDDSGAKPVIALVAAVAAVGAGLWLARR